MDSQTFPGWIHPGRHARTYSSMKNPYFPKSSSSSTSLRGGITPGRLELTCSCGGIIHTFLSHCHTAATLQLHSGGIIHTFLPHCHTAATLQLHSGGIIHTFLPHCYTATLLHCHTATLPHCYNTETSKFLSISSCLFLRQVRV